MKKQAKCLPEHGWEKKATGTGCQRKKPASTDKYQSSARLEMPANPEISLKDHQARIAEKLRNQKGLIVFHGLGSGKTLTAINAAEDYGGAIVVTPASLQDNFKKELKTYGAKGKYDVYSYEKFLRDKPDTKGRMLIVDEAHRVRNSATKGYKAIAAGAEDAEKVLLLTATPIQNKPHELAPLVNIAANRKVLPLSEKEFRNQYIKQEGVPFWQRPFVPANVHSIDKPKNLEEFNREVSKYVDHYAPTKEGYPSVVENTVEVPMTKAQVQAYKFFEEKLDPITKYKMKNNLPLDKQESSNLNAFINAQRQVANTEKAFDVTAKGRSPKTIEIADRIQGGKGKALVYSNFLDSGIKDLSKELGDRRISHRVYTGKLTRKEKDQIIADYNNEKFKVLIVSSAGGEGLDLKRTRQVHIMEPHWNEEKIAQVMGRAIRYKSHEGLPPRDQNVETYQYVSVFPKNFFGFKSGQVTADEYLTALGRKKKALNDQFLGAVKNDSMGKRCGKGWIAKDKKCNPTSSKPTSLSRGIFTSPETTKLRNLQKEKDRLRYKANEAAVIIDNKSGEVVYRGREGTPTGCNIERVEMVRGNIVVHNHPTAGPAKGKSNSFSTQDIALACYHGAEEIHAVNDRYEYRMRPPVGGWSPLFYEKQVTPSFGKHHDALVRSLPPRVRSGELQVDWLGQIKNKDFDPYHEIWENVARDTGMQYSKTEVRKDSVAISVKRSDRQYSDVEKQVGKIIERAYPIGLIDLMVKSTANSKVEGEFFGKDRKAYYFDLDLAKGNLDYKLNQAKTPRNAFRSDAQRKDPDCNVGIPCKGTRGVGCISRRNSCRVKLNRLASPSEKDRLLKTINPPLNPAQKETAVEAAIELTTQQQLEAKTIRELRPLAAQAMVPNYGSMNKRTLVAVLTEIDRLEKSGSKEEANMRKALNKRAQAIDVPPVDLTGIPLTKEQLAEKRAGELVRKRRVAAAKKALAAFFPGASKVVDDFAKAVSVEDLAIASLLAGVVAFKIYGTTRSQYESNYDKTVKRQGKQDVYGETFVPDKKDEISGLYNKETLDRSAATEFVKEEFGVSFPEAQNLNTSLFTERFKNIAETGANKLDDIEYQIAAEKAKFVAEKAKEQEKLDDKLKRAESSERLATTLERDSAAFVNILEGERARLQSDLKRFTGKQGEKVDVKESLLQRSQNLNAIRMVEARDLDSGEKALIDAERKSIASQNPNISEYQLEEKIRGYEQQLRYNRVENALKSTKTVPATKQEVEDSLTELDNLIKNNAKTHSLKMTKEKNEAIAKKREVAILQKQLEAKYAKEPDYKKAAIDEIKARKLKGEGSVPLLPDIGEFNPDKMTRYQAWAYAKYHDYAKKSGRNPADVNQDIRTKKLDLSLSAFKEAYPPTFVVGSQSGSAVDAIEEMKRQNPKLKHKLFIPLDFEDSRKNTFDERKMTGWAYLNRMGAFARKGISASNKIPGFEPDKPGNRDGADIAAAIIAAHQLDLNPNIIAHGVGGNKLREAFDIVDASDDSKALDRFTAKRKNEKSRAQVLILGSPKIGESNSKRTNMLENMYYSDKDFFAKMFYSGVNRKSVPGVADASYKGYLESPHVQKLIQKMFD